jgi:hypothetical protein
VVDLVLVSSGQRVDVWVVDEGLVAVAPREFLEIIKSINLI